jgi:hypothetical protein
VYKSISAISAVLAETGIPKTHINLRGQYEYRSIDDVLNRLAPLLPKHRLCVLPRVLERVSCDRIGIGDALLVSVCLKVAFDIISSADGSGHTVEVFAEALDDEDKATAKAMSSAYKSAMLQTFCIPVPDVEDIEARSPKLRQGHEPEPIGGWPQWVSELLDTIGICESEQALDRVQRTNRSLLLSLNREQPELYRTVGEAFSAQRMHLAQPATGSAAAKTRQEGRADQPSGPVHALVEEDPGASPEPTRAKHARQKEGREHA